MNNEEKFVEKCLIAEDDGWMSIGDNETGAFYIKKSKTGCEAMIIPWPYQNNNKK